MVTEEAWAERVVCGPDVARHRETIQKYVDAGFDHNFLHQIGREQEALMDFCGREILPCSPTGRLNLPARNPRCGRS